MEGEGLDGEGDRGGRTLDLCAETDDVGVCHLGCWRWIEDGLDGWDVSLRLGG